MDNDNEPDDRGLDRLGRGARRVRRVLTSWQFAVASGLAVASWFYVIPMALFLLGRPTIVRHYADELNSAVQRLPLDERAEPLLSLAVQRWPGVPPQDVRDVWPNVLPNDPQWPRLVEYVETLGDSLSQVRSASRRPRLGILLHESAPSRWRLEPVPDAAESDHQLALLADDPLIEAPLPYLGTMRQFTRALAAEGRIALLDGNTGRFIENVEATLGLSRLMGDSPLLLSALVAQAIVSHACSSVGAALDRWPDALDDSQWARLDELLASQSPAQVIDRGMRSELDGWADFLQHSMTDDGRGDGRFCLPGVRRWMNMGTPSQGFLDKLLTYHGFALFQAGRRDTMAMFVELVDAEMDLLAVPRWTRPESLELRRALAVREKLSNSKGFAVLAGLRDIAARPSQSADRLIQTIDGLRAAIAMHRFRAARGAWPASLDELVPAYLERVPLDHVDGKPLRFLIRDDRPIVYSIGCDGVDQGGLAAASDEDRRRVKEWRPPGDPTPCPPVDDVIFPDEFRWKPMQRANVPPTMPAEPPADTAAETKTPVGDGAGEPNAPE